MGSMLVPLLGGVLWQRATPKGAIAAMITGGTIGVGAFAADQVGYFRGLFSIDLGLFIAYAASAIVFVLVSCTKFRIFSSRKIASYQLIKNFSCLYSFRF